MNDRTRIRFGRSMGVVAGGSALAGIIWVTLLSQGFELLWHEWLVHNGAAATGFGLIAWFVIPAQPRNGAVWTSAWVGVFTGMFCLSLAASFQLAHALGMTIDDVYRASPSDLPTLWALIPMLASWLYIPLVLALTVGFLLFPDGRPPSPRWRWALWLSIGAVAVVSAVFLWVFRPSGTLPYGNVSTISDMFALGPVIGPVTVIAELTFLAMVPVCAGAMFARFRRSSGLERQQFRVVVWGAVVATLSFVAGALLDLNLQRGARLALLAGIVVLIGSYGLAIGKYRLYDIDVVISRTIVYGALALFIGAVYVAAVVGVGRAVGSGDQPNPVLAIAATALVAVSFQPLRRRLQQLANRLVFGRRATPYEVLSTFSKRVAVVDPSVLNQIAKALVEGTTAEATGIWMNRGNEMQRVAEWPTDHAFEPMMEPSHLEHVSTVVHGGEQLGLVGLELKPGQPFTPADAALLDQVAGGLGLALRNLRLTEDLRTRLSQLKDSRRRIVAVQDMTRRALERDLHDGAQQRLVALKIKLGIGASLAAKSKHDDVNPVIDRLVDQADETIEAVRDFARGIYPPLLEADGLGPALVTRTARLSIPVTVQAAGITRYSRDLESTVYFCVLEAVHNAVSHSQARSILVTLEEDGDRLTFEVRDDGVGFDLSETGPGLGLTNLTDRLDALDGELEVLSSRGKGTVVRGSIPSRDREAVP